HLGWPWGFLLLALPMALAFAALIQLSTEAYLAGAAGLALAALLLTWLCFQFGVWLRPGITLLPFLAGLAWTAAARRFGSSGTSP
ncbi:MAG: hypothetical protein PHU21_11465, partial [Elusimicrobia bacterium]|nr:hypothetical protein [Elusimicrobiota bacterium]